VPNFIYVQMKNVDKPAKVEADAVEEDKAAVKLLIKKGDKIVGSIHQDFVMGWWTQHE